VRDVVERADAFGFPLATHHFCEADNTTAIRWPRNRRREIVDGQGTAWVPTTKDYTEFDQNGNEIDHSVWDANGNLVSGSGQIAAAVPEK
jgi:hypothetical protein